MPERPIRSSLSRSRVVSTLYTKMSAGKTLRGLHLLPVVVVLSVLAGGCAASAALRRGGDAEHRQDYDAAVVEYTKALRLRPNDSNARLGLERAKQRASQDHLARGRRLSATG